MTSALPWQDRAKQLALSLLRWLESIRYLKFGIVGASGTVVNLTVLYIGHEYIFQAIESTYQKPYISLALAISVATVNNFTWNRLWTWSDRVKAAGTEYGGARDGSPATSILREFGQYATASGFGSALQYGLTLLLSGSMDYRLANLVAILIASVSNFLANDRWTFRRR